MRTLIVVFAACQCSAQLVSSVAIPKGPNPPVVFLNGYQADCRSSTFASTFGSFGAILGTQNRASVFFDNCDYTAAVKPSIEELGNTFAAYLGSLRYTDGTAVPLVDVVAHSMGGLIVRSYLAGKQLNGSYTPPATVPIRKVIFLATPHFGTPLTSGLPFDVQLQELTVGSTFLFDLATWNQGTDDLRGLDVLALAGNGGTGQATMPRFDDGVVSLSSAAIGFARQGRTRILPYCHTGPGAITIVALCPANTPAIASVSSITDITARIVVSFLGDGVDWTIYGQPAPENEFLFNSGGVILREKSNTDQFLPISAATANGVPLAIRGGATAYSEYFIFPTETFTLTSAAATQTQTFRVTAGTVTAAILKDGPLVARVLPSAGNVFPLAIGSNSYISIYGSGLDRAQVTSGSTVLTLIANTPTQINAVFTADPAQRVVPLTVTTPGGSQTVNVFTQPNVPVIFTQNSSGAGPAAALNAVTGTLVSPNAPLHAGDYVSLYLTGLTFPRFFAPEVLVTIAGRSCPVQYVGLAPGYTVLDQINCQIPGGISSNAAPVIVTAAGVASNPVTLAVQ